MADELPAEPSERLLRTVRRFEDRLPALRAQFAAHLDAPAEVVEPEQAEPEPVAEQEAAAEAEQGVESEAAAEADQAVEPEVAAEPVQAEEPAEAVEASDVSGEAVQDAEAGEELPQPGGEIEVV